MAFPFSSKKKVSSSRIPLPHRPVIRGPAPKAPEHAPVYEATVTSTPPRRVSVEIPSHPAVPVTVVDQSPIKVLVKLHHRDQRMLMLIAASLFTFAFISFMNWIMRLF
uniref:Uncharacterized protein n=1 Tax=Panagrolaimus sp. ES5 TaxID=591445 RepID=A0AC34FRQ6_9BILA